MSADGYVINMDEPVEIHIRCYICSKSISDPKEHLPCLLKHPRYENHLPVAYEMDNVSY